MATPDDEAEAKLWRSLATKAEPLSPDAKLALARAVVRQTIALAEENTEPVACVEQGHLEIAVMAIERAKNLGAI